VFIAQISLHSSVFYADPTINDRAQALYFLRSHYAQSVADPSTCCYSTLSSHYTKYRNVSLSSYITFFNTLSDVKVQSLEIPEENYFKASMIYTAKSGKVIPEEDLFSLHCEERKLRWQNCSAEDILIWDYIGDVK
jgi:hypothetical protein